IVGEHLRCAIISTGTSRTQMGSAGARDSLMTWVTLSNGACPRFFPLEAGISDLARPLIFRGEKGVTPKQRCRGVHAPIMVLLRGKSVTHVMRSCPPPASFAASANGSSTGRRARRFLVEIAGSRWEQFSAGRRKRRARAPALHHHFANFAWR